MQLAVDEAAPTVATATEPEPATEASAPLTMYVVSHTHWDREWYLPFQSFRVKLVRLVDKLLGILDSDPDYEYFTLDGQTVVLEDYLEIRPERADEIRAYVESGRLLVGPWYILPDEFLVSGEAIIRNFLRGRAIAEDFGASMRVGYIPDPFGHISQMPQILRGFGIDWAVFWRGIGSDIPRTEFIWEAADGSEVLATRLLSGYANGLPLSFSLAAARRQVAWLRETEAPLCSTNSLLVLNGDDHIAPGEELSTILATLNAELEGSGVRLVHSTLPAYREAIIRGLQGDDLPTHRGEFREAAHANLLPNVLSTRIWIKQANYAAETLLERWVEPWEGLLWALAATLGPADVAQALRLDSAVALRQTAWKYLLQNQPHDSICGCSVDTVHDEMRTRFASVEQIGGALRDEALLGVAGFVNTAGAGADGRLAVVVYNPLGSPRTDVVEATVEVTASLHDFRLLNAAGEEIPYEVVERRGQQVASFDLEPAALETALAMATDGRVMGMAVTDVFMHREGEAGVVNVDVTVAETGEPDLLAVQTAADAARRLVAAGQVRVFRLRGHHAGQVVARFIAHDVPGLGYRTYTVAASYADLQAPADAAVSTNGASDAPAEEHVSATPSESAPHPAALYQPEPPLAAEPAEATAGAGQLHPAIVPVAPGLAQNRVIENQWLRVEVDADSGSLSVSDKQSGLSVRRGNVFADSGDAGDEYNYCPPETDAVIEGFDRPPRIEARHNRLGSEIVIEGELALPISLSEDRRSRSLVTARCGVRSVIRLWEGVRRVDVTTTVDNLAADHRLRVLFDAPVRTDHSDAEGAFDVVRRPTGVYPGNEDWFEPAVATYPQKSFVAVGDGQRGLLLANRGLPEFEALPSVDGTQLALTLLRCVGWLSREDLPTRPLGHAGPGVVSPGGQELGVHTFEYSLVPYAGNWLDSGAYRQAHGFAAPMRAHAEPLHDGPLPHVGTFVACEPPELVLSALKRGEDGTRLILRAWSISDRPIQASIRLPSFVKSAELARLDETADLEAGGRMIWEPGPPPSVSLEVGPRQIVTLSLAVADGR